MSKTKTSLEELEENHQAYLQRKDLYKDKGLDQEQARKNIINKLDPGHKQILEIGTGKGYLTIMLAQNFPKIVTVDIDVEEQRIAKMNIEYAGYKDKVKFVISNTKSLLYKKKSFDAVVSAFTFHHLKEPYTVLDEMIKLTKHQLIISDFNDYGFSIIEKIQKLEGRSHHRECGDFNIVGTYLEKNGFLINEFEDEWQKMYIGEKTSKILKSIEHDL
ncbi:class I SAM-dependent methyltransferase [bacterium]|jgi:ubiquinone/menaquinone biosynthesis C-methylase UbiE|nr:class I SAM-dependent methyltransferase [bacterium]MBT3581518.1 class I SAM-dependent methyltransferase [bacterium]MBT4551526.1 class I SAM-dependent methyltransferase [bacterium]MBT5988506.1 class I SAM-dependent methyltransferase [bacterium]MBT7087534.1 class I SAM-dependent methyltransferase [bacterium]